MEMRSERMGLSNRLKNMPDDEPKKKEKQEKKVSRRRELNTERKAPEKTERKIQREKEAEKQKKIDKFLKKVEKKRKEETPSTVKDLKDSVKDQFNSEKSSQYALPGFDIKTKSTRGDQLNLMTSLGLDEYKTEPLTKKQKRERAKIKKGIDESLKNSGVSSDIIDDKTKEKAIAEAMDRVHYIPIDDIKVKPKLMQFKTNIDAEGVTDKYKDVKEWIPIFANALVLWRSKEGELIVADGHHRMEMAKRLGAKNINAFVLDEKRDGITAADARVTAAKLNIAQGSADLKDAAKYMRETKSTLEDLEKSGVPLAKGLAQKAYNVAQLNDHVYDLFVNEQISEGAAATIGELFKNDSDAQSFAADMTMNDPEISKLPTDRGSKYRYAMGGLKDTIKLAAKARVKEGKQLVIGGTGGTDQYIDKRTLHVQVAKSRIKDDFKKMMNNMLDISRSKQNLENKAEKTDFVKKIGIELKDTDMDLNQMKTAINEVHYRLHKEGVIDDPEMKGKLNEIMERKFTTQGDDPTKWKATQEDLNELVEHFVNNYESTSIDPEVRARYLKKQEEAGKQPEPKPEPAKELAKRDIISPEKTTSHVEGNKELRENLANYRRVYNAGNYEKAEEYKKVVDEKIADNNLHPQTVYDYGLDNESGGTNLLTPEEKRAAQDELSVGSFFMSHMIDWRKFFNLNVA